MRVKKKRKKARKQQPTPKWRTMQYVENVLGGMAADCEIVRGNSRKDAFGFADVVCIFDQRNGVTLIQATDHSSHGKHRTAMQNDPDVKGRNIRRAIKTGNTVELWSWHPKKDVPRREIITETTLL